MHYRGRNGYMDDGVESDDGFVNVHGPVYLDGAKPSTLVIPRDAEHTTGLVHPAYIPSSYYVNGDMEGFYPRQQMYTGTNM